MGRGGGALRRRGRGLVAGILSFHILILYLTEDDGPDLTTTGGKFSDISCVDQGLVRGPGAVGGSRERCPVPKESNNPSFMCAGSAKTGSPRDRLLSPRIGLGVVHHTLATKNK